MENNKDLHEVYIKLEAMGATKEDIINVFKIAFETADKVINGNQK